MNNLMNNSNALRGKYNKFLRRCKAIHLKKCKKIVFFDQKINYSEKSANRKDLRSVQRGRK